MNHIIKDLNFFLYQKRDYALLIFRIILGGMFIWHGYPKITGGIETWTNLGKSLSVVGITFAPAMFGFLSGLSEFVGGICFVLGFFYRIASFFLFSNMIVAFGTQMIAGKGLFKASQSLEDGAAFLAAVFIGPGKYSLDAKLGFLNDKNH
ncbi:DoxX family protein [Anaerosinus massiliensis]|uniref:DoxX family protein n=1 Tax=Massilibacillus massiliensis TaxID=1806837 RepID=UPI000DA5F16F|nr:DoxX family protein [Massilibacillus massiliensis]